jgi:hypothetical protein
MEKITHAQPASGSKNGAEVGGEQNQNSTEIASRRLTGLLSIRTIVIFSELSLYFSFLRYVLDSLASLP